MSIELNRNTFRRLVQLNWLALLAVVPLAVWQAFSQGWNDFDEAFVQILRETYGYSKQPDWLIWAFGALALSHITAAVGIYWFKPWSRWLVWVSILTIAALDMVTGQAAIYEATIQSWLGTFSDAIFGVVVFTSYCRPIADEFGAVHGE